jgi:hypothetical protein
MTAEQWVEQFATEIGAERPSEDEFARILELAAEAAHSAERTAAPVACWIAGRAGMPLPDLIEAAKRTGDG